MATAVIRSIPKSEGLSIKIPNGTSGKNIYFPDDQYIRNVHLIALSFTPNLNEFNGTGDAQTDPDGNLLISSDFAAFCYLTLEAYNGNQFVRQRPLMDFFLFNNSKIGLNVSNQFIGQMVNWPKSFITVAVGAPTIGGDRWARFDIDFKPSGTKGKNEMQSLINQGFNNKG